MNKLDRAAHRRMEKDPRRSYAACLADACQSMPKTYLNWRTVREQLATFLVPPLEWPTKAR